MRLVEQQDQQVERAREIVAEQAPGTGTEPLGKRVQQVAPTQQHVAIPGGRSRCTGTGSLPLRRIRCQRDRCFPNTLAGTAWRSARRNTPARTAQPARSCCAGCGVVSVAALPAAGLLIRFPLGPSLFCSAIIHCIHLFMSFPHDVGRAALGLQIRLRQILAHDAQAQQLDTTEHGNDAGERWPARNRIAHQESAYHDEDDPDEGDQA